VFKFASQDTDIFYQYNNNIIIIISLSLFQ